MPVAFDWYVAPGMLSYGLRGDMAEASHAGTGRPRGVEEHHRNVFGAALMVAGH